MVSSYFYDGYGRRIQTTLPSGTVRDSFFDPDEHLISETPQFSPGNLTSAPYYDYVWFGGRPVAQVDSTGTHWTYADYLGTPLIQTDINANVTWQAEYDPYGSVYALRAGDVHQPLRFPGQSAEQFDMGANGISELSYNNARWYQPTWGRYTQPDPFDLNAGSNLYAYVGGDPLRLSDPLGEQTIPWWGWAGAGAAEGAGAGPEDPFADAAATAILLAARRAAAAAAIGAAASLGLRSCNKDCPPCSPYPAGTYGYTGPKPDKEGKSAIGPDGERVFTKVHYFEVRQDANCHCEWGPAGQDWAFYSVYLREDYVDLNDGFPELSP